MPSSAAKTVGIWRPGMLARLAAGFALVLAVAACSSSKANDTGAGTTPSAPTVGSAAATDGGASAGASSAKARTVRYQIEGVGALTYIKYDDGSRNVTRRGSDIRLPWKIEVPCCESLSYEVVAIARNSSTPLTCKMFADGRPVDEEKSAGTVSCRWVPD